MNYDEEKEQRGIQTRLARVCHELNAFCADNLWTKRFSFHWEIGRDGKTAGMPIVHGDWTSDKIKIEDAITMLNPVGKYFAENHKISYYQVMKTWEDWTSIIRYFRFFMDGKSITPKVIRENVGIDPIEKTLKAKNFQHLTMEEYEWMFWVRNSHAVEWPENWYIMDSVFYLRLYGQLLEALKG